MTNSALNTPEKRKAARERYRVRPGQELTFRERQVIAQVLTGASNLTIANVLCIEETTVKFHLTRIFRKLGLKNRTQLVLHQSGRG